MFMATRKVSLKRHQLKSLQIYVKQEFRQSGMRDDDELIEVKLTDSDCDIILVTKLEVEVHQI